MKITYEQPAKGDKPALQYDVEASFSLHCFTKGIGVNEQLDKDLLYSDSRETRIFEFRRYELSKTTSRDCTESTDTKVLQHWQG